MTRAALSPPLPTPEKPVIFYSNQKRDDFRLVLHKLFSKATTSIHITMYAATDDRLLKQLLQKSRQGLSVKIYHDPSNPSNHPLATPLQAKGLMHRKIVVVDNTTVILGSANMTTSSLVLHDNLSVGFYHPPLAHFLQSPTTTKFQFTVQNLSCKLWLLPDKDAFFDLTARLNTAKKSIFVAMFTLTHPELLNALLHAKARGVAVTVVVDHFAARGASRKAVQFLQDNQINTLFSQGLQLLHHKWAYIDRSQIVLGSTNWTKAAFTKNQDCLLFLENLSPTHQQLFDNLAKTILLESNTCL